MKILSKHKGFNVQACISQVFHFLYNFEFIFAGRSGPGAAANDFFELDNDDDLGGLGECLEAPGSETINGGQDEVMQHIEEEMAAMRTTTASPPQPPPPGSNFIYLVHGIFLADLVMKKFEC